MSTTFLVPLAITFAIGYALGSIPFGLILTRAAGLGDVRNIGSGNIGATNVLRTGNKGLAAATLLLDALKGAAAVLATFFALKWFVAGMVSADESRLSLIQAAPWSAALGAVCGHVFPVWLSFKGGKGVATYIGALVMLHWQAAALFAILWLLVAAATRYSSLAALVAALAVLGYFLLLAPGSFAAVACVLLTALLFWKHRENIRRLLAGEENRIGAKG